MRNLLIGMLAVMVPVLFAGPATAAKLLRQNADGTACWHSNVTNTCIPVGERSYTVYFDDITSPATRYIVIPHEGRLKSASVHIEGEIVTASETIIFYISRPASFGGIFGAHTAVTPNIAEQSTGTYELVIGLSYAATDQRSFVDWPFVTEASNTSLNFDANDIIIVHTLGNSTASDAASNDGRVTIVVH